VLVQAVILMVAARPNGTGIQREAATLYKVDTEAITAKVKQEFAAREKAKSLSLLPSSARGQPEPTTSTQRGGLSAPHLLSPKCARRTRAVSPLHPLRSTPAPLAGCAAGVQFLLLHIPL
jgi:hypothetical protein